MPSLSFRLTFLSAVVTTLLAAQPSHPPTIERDIHFPDTENYHTLVCDLHLHTVFSDGSVWPDIRVEEALRDSLDAIAITEHLEYQPHAEDVPHPDRNRAYQIAEQRARPHELMVIPGAEITRSVPPGHCNAIFIEDANALLIEDSLAVFEEAARQNAFVFWNHPDWSDPVEGRARMNDFQRLLIERGLLHGVEIVNDLTISAEALQLAIDYDLTFMGTSDIHGLVDWQFHVHEGGHRPVTLVLAEERSAASIREALFAGRTVVWFDNTLIGRRPHLTAVVEASLTVTRARYRGPSSLLDVTLRNASDCSYLLELDPDGDVTGNDFLGILELPAGTETTFSLKTGAQRGELELNFRVLNALTAPDTSLPLRLALIPD